MILFFIPPLSAYCLDKRIRSFSVNGFVDTPAKRLVVVTDGVPVGFDDADTSVLAFVTVFGANLIFTCFAVGLALMVI